MTDFVSVTDAAELLGISPMTVRRWASEGKIDARRMGGQWRIVKSAVQNLLGVAVRVGREDSPLPHAHQILNPWIEQRRAKFQNYIHSHVELFQPDLLILVDRKGRLFDSLELIPAGFAEKVIYPSALRWMKAESFKGKRAIILEESIQRGRNLRRIRRELEELGAEVLCLTLIRRRSLFESGELVEPTAKTCLDLTDEEFSYATAQISSVLQSDVICLDVDHFPTCQLRLKSEVSSFDVMAPALGSLGRLFILPSPAPGMKVTCFTVDAPHFFDWDKLRLPKSVKQEGVTKLRIYYDYRQHTPALYIVPVVFPQVFLTAQDVARIAQSADEVWSRYIDIPPDAWDGFSLSEKAELIYRCLVIFCSTQLMLQALPHLRGLAEELNLDLSLDAFAVSDQGLNRTFGSIKTAGLAERVKRELEESWEKTIQAKWQPVTLVRPNDSPLNGQHHDDGKDVDMVLRTLLDASVTDDDIATGLSRTELLEKLGWTPDRLSRVFDFGLDRGLLKPLVEIRNENGTFHCLRTYRATEYGSWWKGSKAYTPDALYAKRMSLIIPYVLDRLMSKGGSLADGVPDLLRDKVFTNLQHDWDTDKFDRLYLGWAPHFFGPIPNVPALNQPSGGFQSVGQFAIERGVCELQTVDRKNSKKKVLVPRSNVKWREKFASSMKGIERDYLEGLIDIYYNIFHAFESADPLITLSACRTRFVTYVCAYQDLILWRDHLELALEQMDLNFGSADPPLLTTALERSATGRTQMEDKLGRYERLGEAKKVLSDRLKDYPRAALAQDLLDRLEVPSVDNQEPYPLGRMKRLIPLIHDLSVLIHSVATKLGMASEKRPTKSRHKCSYYVARLRDAYPEFVTDDLVESISMVDSGKPDSDLVDRLRALFLKVTRLIGRDLKDPQDYSADDGAHDRLLMRVGEATSKVGDVGDVGILLIDIQGFVESSIRLAELEDTSADDAAEKFRRRAYDELTTNMNELRLEPVFTDPVGGDGWLIAAADIEALLELACRMHRARSNALQVMTFKTAITFGNPARVTPGASVGRAFIKAYYVAEKTGMASGTIRLTDEAAAQISSPELRTLLQKLEEPFTVRTFDPCELYEVDWSAYGERA